MTPADRLDFFDTLVRSQIELWNAVDRSVTAASGMSLGLATALRVVDELAGAARVQDVADTVVITVGAASKIVDRLERDGFVRRVPNPDDRRSSLIEVTPRGAGALALALDAQREALARATAGVDDERLVAAGAVLGRIRADA